MTIIKANIHLWYGSNFHMNVITHDSSLVTSSVYVRGQSLLKDRVRRRFPFFFLCSRTGCDLRVSQQSILKSQAGNYHQAGPEITAIPIWLHAIAFQQRRAQIQTPAGLSLEAAAQLTVYYVLLKLTQPNAAHTEDRRVWKAALFPFFYRVHSGYI